MTAEGGPYQKNKKPQITNQGADLIRIFDDPEALSRGAAELLVSIARQAVAARGRFSIALSGGATPRRT